MYFPTAFQNLMETDIHRIGGWGNRSKVIVDSMMSFC